MSELTPSDLQRLAMLSASGFETSADALIAVSKHVEHLCEDLIARQSDSLREITNGLPLSKLKRSARRSFLGVVSQIEQIKKAKSTFPRVISFYWDMVRRSEPTEKQAEQALFMMAKMVDDLVQVGALHMLGMPEEDLPRPAITNEQASKGGKESGKIRGQLAEDTWITDALIRAQNTYDDDPSLTMNDLMDRMLDNWPSGKWKPKRDRLGQVIRKWRKEGKLGSRRQPETVKTKRS